MSELVRRLIFLVAVSVTPLAGQQLGHYLQGFAGLTGGSMTPPGYYVTVGPYNYFVSSIKGSNGGSIPASITVTGYLAPVISGVIKTKFLGADFGFALAPTITNQRLTTNLVPGRSPGTYGISDFYFMPVQLGWHQPKADIMFSYSLYAPTGDFSSDQVFNNGLGMWTHQLQLGTTYYLEKTKKWNASLLSTWEINTKKSGTDITPAQA